MRELDFVPDWYASVRRRKKLIKGQASLIAVAVLALLAWHYFDVRRVNAAVATLSMREKQVDISAGRVRERQTQQQLRDQLQTQEKVDASLGLNVESSRLLAMLDAALPRQGSLTELQIETDENARTLAQLAASKTPGTVTPDRRMKVTLKGVTPSNGDIASLLQNLSDTQYCEGVRLIYSRDRIDGDHVMCEFNIEFTVNLNSEGVAAS